MSRHRLVDAAVGRSGLMGARRPAGSPFVSVPTEVVRTRTSRNPLYGASPAVGRRSSGRGSNAM